MHLNWMAFGFFSGLLLLATGPALAQNNEKIFAKEAELEALQVSRARLDKRISDLAVELKRLKSGATKIDIPAVTFDGRWRFLLIYDSRANIDCIGGKLIARIEIRDGKIGGFFNHPEAGHYQLKGTVDSDGILKGIALGLDTTDIVGSLSAKIGSGRWESRVYKCGGVWESKKLE